MLNAKHLTFFAALSESFFIISHYFPFVKYFFQISLKNFDLFRFCIFLPYRGDLIILPHNFTFVKYFFQKNQKNFLHKGIYSLKRPYTVICQVKIFQKNKIKPPEKRRAEKDFTYYVWKIAICSLKFIACAFSSWQFAAHSCAVALFC